MTNQEVINYIENKFRNDLRYANIRLYNLNEKLLIVKGPIPSSTTAIVEVVKPPTQIGDKFILTVRNPNIINLYHLLYVTFNGLEPVLDFVI